MLSSDEFMAQVGGLPYFKRNGFATKYAMDNINEPKLLTLIQDLLATSLLPSRVPYPSLEADAQEFIELQFPQTTASKKFVQRELALIMAIAMGRSALPVLLESLLHPSTSGRSTVVDACVKYGSDEEIADIYRRCVPAVQKELRDSFTKAGRLQLKTILGLPLPLPPKVAEPETAVLEVSLKTAAEYQREEAWNKTTLAYIWPHHQLHNPEYISKDSPVNLMEKLFNLVEAFPPTRSSSSKSGTVSYKLPTAISNRFLAFLKTDLPRSLALVTRFCHVVDSEDLGRDTFSAPNSFMEGRYCARFWHSLDLQTQQTHVEPFIANLLETNNGALLKNGGLLKADLLSQVRWPVVSSITNKAIALLKGCCVSDKLDERKNVINFILSALTTLHHRLVALASIDSASKREDQSAIEKGVSELLAQTIKQFLSSLTATEKSDQAIVEKLQSVLIGPTISLLDQYHILTKLLFENVRGIFSMQNVSKTSLQAIAPPFLRALTPKTRTIHDIPDNGITQPYSNLPSGDNDSVFQVMLTLWPPREHLYFYTHQVCRYLSQTQKDYIWSTFLNDTDYFLGLIYPLTNENSSTAFAALSCFPPSPSSRHAIVSAAIAHPESNDSVFQQLYALADISDTATRAALTKQTYTRLFEDRLQVYRTLITATMAAKSVKEFIKTMQFFIPRIKNEIPPDAQSIPYLFAVGTIVSDIFRVSTEQEASEIAAVYVAWENQCNEAVSPIPAISSHILSVVNECLTAFAGNPSSIFFQMALKYSRLRYVTLSASQSREYRDEADELAFRKFLTTVDKDFGDYGFWRIQDEVGYVDNMYRQLQKVYENQPFETSTAYPEFMRVMLNCLGVRWSKVPLIRDYVNKQMDIIRAAGGTGDSPSDWKKAPVVDAVSFILKVRKLYNEVMEKDPLPWWKEFRDLRLLSSSAILEVDARAGECRDEKGVNAQKSDALIELLLRTHQTAVYMNLVSAHLIDNRQDLLRDEYITEGRYGVFNPAPEDYLEGDKVEPAEWDFQTASRFFPRQCEVFASHLLDVIRSNEFPLQTRVRATEKYTKLPTTTIHELAALLKEDINPRVSEAILMFMPRLDEPAAGIQFLLAPAILDGELARTAVHSVKRSLEHVPLASVPAFLELPTSKPLKIGVFKELVRIITTYIQLPEMQALVKGLWDRPLHQDVRIALLQSIIPALDSPQQDLAWYIIDKAVASLDTLQADNTLLVLLAVAPEVTGIRQDDVLHSRVPAVSPVLEDMATVTIPQVHCERYIETVLWPLTRISLNNALAESIKADKKMSAELVERIPIVRAIAYMTCFNGFLNRDNAVRFAERTAKDAREKFIDAGLEKYKAGEEFGNEPDDLLFIFLVTSIGRCVAQNQESWSYLLGTIDLLASRAAEFQREPTPQGHRSIKQIRDLRLTDNFLFDRPDQVRAEVTHNRMELLKPFADHGVQDFIATVAYQRRFNLFRTHVARVLILEDGDLAEIRTLLAENIKLSHTTQHSADQVTTSLVVLLGVIPAVHVPAIRAEILDGDHGVAEAPWVNKIQLMALEKAYASTESYAKELDKFHTHIAIQQPAFYQNNWKAFEKLIRTTLNESNSIHVKDALGFTTAFNILVKPVIERQATGSGCERDMVLNLFNDFSHLFFRQAPDCAQNLIHDALVQTRPGNPQSLAQARKMVQVLISHVTLFTKDAASFSACFIAEAVYSGSFLSLALDKTDNHSLGSTHRLSFPYFFGSDESGGDIEDRSAKSSVAGVQKLYDNWKAKHTACFFKKSSDTKSAYSSSTALNVVLTVYGNTPKLIVAHPGLFFSCLCLSLSDPDLFSHSDALISSLQQVLTPVGGRTQQSDWVPPAELTLSFVQKMLVELPQEVSDAVVGEFEIGAIEIKFQAVKLLSWWSKTILKHYKDMVEVEGRTRLLSIYGNLRELAIRDKDAAVRVTALKKLRKASEL
ncbi:hypothetical protein C8J56DRAFT_935742 [Mycena floridula]|nr:hypothetical protein C8J56DRAFT_935742 [Mycena floridula]